MVLKINRSKIVGICILLLITILTACSPQNQPTVLTSTETAASSPQTESPKESPEPSATTTIAPPTVFFDSALPEGIFMQNDLPGIVLSSDQNASLWFGLTDSAPEGSPLLTATWVYALAAPFPTLTDTISLNDLRLFWGGHPHGELERISRLYVPENVRDVLEQRWYPGASETVTTYQGTPDIGKLWQENAWAIIPFDKLSPKLKVISISGTSPLHKDFDPTYYPLVFTYQLVQNQNDPTIINEESIQTLVAAIQPTNRDPDKMTTLVMTGVTALVRATASKMEEKGVLYPGEAIQQWLSEADLTHISNEVSFYENCPFPSPNYRPLLFCSDPKYIELFEYIGADIIELTGNHNNDMLYVRGDDVVPFNFDLYEARGMLTFGGGRDLEEAKKPLVLTHHGNQIAFIGCNAPGPDFAWATDDQGGAAPCGDFQWMADEISRLRQDGILPIATFQYYEDYYNFPETHHIEDFGRMAEAGAVIVNGSQAHRPKAMAFDGDTYIDYGLGNLFFDQMGIIDDYGNQILQTRWEKIQRHTFYDGRYISTEILTAILEDYAQPRPMNQEERQAFLTEIFSASGWDLR